MKQFMKLPSCLLAGFLFFTACQKNQAESSSEKLSETELNTYERAYFASGCFWCVEAVFESVVGVKEVVSGYSGGKEENPTYKQVSRGQTTHAEAVEVYYDPQEIDFKSLVDVFFGSQNPTTINGQGPDRGGQYRSIAFYQTADEKATIEAAIKYLNETVYNGQVATQVVPFEKFWVAEAYHQDYEKKNPNNQYVQRVSIPRLKKFQAQFPHLVKKDALD